MPNALRAAVRGGRGIRFRRVIRRPRSALVALLLAALLAATAEARADWTPPARGPVSRAFDYGSNPFARGRHRGVDFAAPAGAPVRATCAGRVEFAGAVAQTRAVTLRCGRFRVTHLPLRAIAVRPGRTVAAGTALGRLASSASHDGLHLGVRDAANRFGYVDPLPFLRRAHHAPPVGPPPATRPVTPAVPPFDSPRAPRLPAEQPPPPRLRTTQPAPQPGLPWPAYLGAGLLLAALAAGAAAAVRHRPAASGHRRKFARRISAGGH